LPSIGGYWFGSHIHRLAAPAGVALAVIAVIAVVYVTRAIARREQELVLEAERAFPGPLRDSEG
jgi:hypothetical protein